MPQVQLSLILQQGLSVHIKFNLSLLEFSLGALWRRKVQNFGTFFIFTALVWLLCSVLLISDSMKKELFRTLEATPEITLQKIRAGKQVEIDVSIAQDLLMIEGVSLAIPRVWGYYYFKPADVYFAVMGIDQFGKQSTKSLQALVDTLDVQRLETDNAMIIGRGVQEVLRQNYYPDFFNFVTPQGDWKRVEIAGVFDSSLQLESNDVILISKNNAYEIFGMDPHVATDIVLRVSNLKEVATIVQKITQRYPDIRAITTEDLRMSYQHLFDYKSGLFLSIFLISVFTFFMIVFERSSGLSIEEKREIGILKALGWGIDEILSEKFYEGIIISISAFFSGITLAIFFVYSLQAPLLRDIFMGYSALKPPLVLSFSMDFGMVTLLFFLSIPIYLAAVLIPAWRASTLDADEVMR